MTDCLWKTLPLLVAVLCHSASAIAEAELPVVKVTSTECGNKEPSKPMHGSGYAISYEDKSYVISSSHVVFHGGEPEFCHIISLPRWREEAKARLVAVNIGNGLALLELETTPKNLFPVPFGELKQRYGAIAEDADTFDTLPSKTTIGNSASIIGYRHRGGSKIELHNETIRSFSSVPEIFPFVPTMYEVAGITEFGMSGGPVFHGYATPVDLLGILSHHYYQLNEGAAPTLMNRSEGQHAGEYSNIVIPITVVLPWVATALTKNPEAANLSLVAAAQVHNRVALRLGHYKLSEVSCLDGGVGGQGSGIGGQGSGIGGKKQANLCAIEIQKMEEKEPLPYLIASSPNWPAFSAWLDELEFKDFDPRYVIKLRDGNDLHSLGHFLFHTLNRETANIETITKDMYEARLRQVRSQSRASCKRQVEAKAKTVEGGCLDEHTQLAWSAVSATTKYGFDAFSTCVTYNIGGTGWRLPTQEEIEDLWQREFADLYLYADVDESYWIEAGIAYVQTKSKTFYEINRPREEIQYECHRAVVNLTDGTSISETVMTVDKVNGKWIQNPWRNSAKHRVLCVKDMRPLEEQKWRENEFTYQNSALCNIVSPDLGFKVPEKPFPHGVRNPFPYN